MLKYIFVTIIGVAIVRYFERNKRIVCQKCGWSWKVKDGGADGLIINSTSLAIFNVNTLGANDYYIGHTTYGWNDRSWDFIFDNGVLLLPIAQNNCVFSLPYDLVNGDTLTLCGTSYTTENCTGLEWFVGAYICSNGLLNADYPIEIIGTGSATYDYYSNNQHYMCFDDLIEIGKSYNTCDAKLVIGFRVPDFTNSTQVKISWTLKKKV